MANPLPMGRKEPQETELFHPVLVKFRGLVKLQDQGQVVRTEEILHLPVRRLVCRPVVEFPAVEFPVVRGLWGKHQWVRLPYLSKRPRL